MSIRVAINGFGRIGRLILRAAFAAKNGCAGAIEWVAVNDLTDAATLAHLFAYDSTFGRFAGDVKAQGNKLIINGTEIEVTSVKEPRELPWGKLGVDYVVESTGRFTEAEKAKGHLEAGAKRVIISAPAKGEDLTVCMGINEEKYDPVKHRILSNASCTTNCLAPLAKVLHETFTIDRGFMVTIHAFTNDQPVLDFQHKDLRRARAAGLSMIPTSTGAAKAIGLVLPELSGKLNGIAIRVPTPTVSIVNFSTQVAKPTGKEEVNQTFKKAAETAKLKKYLAYNDAPLVSKDFQGNPASCIFDATLTEVIDGTLVNIFGWYDNEWGYSSRVVDLAAYLASKEPKTVAAKKTVRTTR
ncbi:MAG: type I glyceraldehyde-3-phosphate dehydrogenase [Elusimicrobia bacterium]|nr:type I glyceraldehyde-3-phosphate dehydrogenase [Elusimicrobiota bacterium]